MILDIKIQSPQGLSNMIGDIPTTENIITQVKRLCYDVNMFVGDMKHQRDRVRALNHGIKSLLEHIKYYHNSYEFNKIIDNVKWFILITDHSFINFNIEVQMIINNEFIRFSLKN